MIESIQQRQKVTVAIKVLICLVHHFTFDENACADSKEH